MATTATTPATTVAPVYNLTQNQTPTASNTLGKDDFLKLLTTQLTNQDPLNPMDDQQMVAQLAQFSQLEQLTNMTGDLDAMKTAQIQNTNSQLVNYLGKSVEAQGSSFSVSSGAANGMKFSLPSATADTTVSILDSTGNVVNSYDLGPLAIGDHPVSWDCKDANGKAVADGQYSYIVTSTDANKSPVTATTYTNGTVTGVNYGSDGTGYLVVNGTQIPISSLTTISQ